LRALFVQAAWVGLVRPTQWERYGLKSWIEAAKKRLHHNVLAIALADKLARIAWAVLNRAAPSSSSRPMRWRPVQMCRAQGPSRLAVALALPLASVPPGHALTAPEHGARPGMPLTTRVPWINPIPENSLKPNQPLIPRFEARKSRSGRACPDATEEGWLHRLSLRQYCAAIISQFQA
jgi:hypothetical protein